MDAIKLGMTWRVLLSVVLALSLATAAKGGSKRYEFGLDAVREALVRGEIEDALAYYERFARSAAEYADGDRGLQLLAARAYRDAALAASFSGLLQKAIIYGHKSFTLFESLGPRYQLRSIPLLVQAYKELGEFDKAKTLVATGFELIEATSPFWIHEWERSYWTARFYSNLGTVLMRENKHGEATRALSNALSFSETLPFYRSEDPENVANRIIDHNRNLQVLTLLRLGNAHREMGKPVEAMGHFQQALGFIRKWKFHSLNDANLFAAMGAIYFDLKQYDNALEHFIKALELEKARRPGSLVVAATSRKIGDVLRTAGKSQEAIPYYKDAATIVESVRALLHQDYRNSYFAQALGVHVQLIETLADTGMPREAFDYNERARSRQFLDLLENKFILFRGRKAPAAEGNALLAKITEIREKLARGMHEDGVTPALAEAETAYVKYLSKVRQADAEHASLISVEPATLPEVQRLLEPDTSLIEYFVTDNGVLIWLVTRDAVTLERSPLTRDELRTAVESLRQGITNLETAESLAASSSLLYNALIGPIRSRLHGKRLVVVPHDVLHYLPFQVLLSPEERYLIRDYEIRYLPSASLLEFTTSKRRPSAPARILAVGDPQNDSSAGQLASAGVEARQIQQLYADTTVLLGSEATEMASRTLAPRHDILHFATHTRLSEDDPLSSALLLAPSEASDGSLEVQEIFEMNLDADLVVLSGCETGLGKLTTGDEFVGLTRAFIYAGAPTVVASLWKVEDRATAKLMTTFYRNLKTMSKAEALREAQLEMLGTKSSDTASTRRGVGGITTLAHTAGKASLKQADVSSSHPYFWAPFVLVGNGD